MNRSEV